MLQADQKEIKKFLYDILAKNISAQGIAWLDKKLEIIEASESSREFFTTFSIAPRFVGKENLKISREDITRARQITDGYVPEALTGAQAARILLLLAAYKNDKDAFYNIIDKLLSASDIQEQVAIYSAFPFLPHPEVFVNKATEGIRTNMTVVFDTIALNNPYPAAYLPEDAWNQMVLKSIFIDRPIYKIVGFDQRRNPALAQMLSDFAHERWAAGRTVPYELWRATAPFLEGQILNDVDKVLGSDDSLNIEAGCLACWESNNSQAKAKLDKFPEVQAKIASKELTWYTFGEKIEQSK